MSAAIETAAKCRNELAQETLTRLEYLDAQQFGVYTNTGARMARRLVAERRIAFVKVGRHVRFRRADVDAWLLAQTVQPVTGRTARRSVA